MSINPEMSRRGARIIHTKVLFAVSHEERLAFIHDVERANTVDDLTPKNRLLWRRAEEEIVKKMEERR